MKTYELTIEEKQPTCGGRTPTKCEVTSVTTDDPMAYVMSLEPGAVPEIIKDEDGEIIIKVDRNRGLWARYEFVEE